MKERKKSLYYERAPLEMKGNVRKTNNFYIPLVSFRLPRSPMPSRRKSGKIFMYEKSLERRRSGGIGKQSAQFHTRLSYHSHVSKVVSDKKNLEVDENKRSGREGEGGCSEKLVRAFVIRSFMYDIKV